MRSFIQTFVPDLPDFVHRDFNDLEVLAKLQVHGGKQSKITSFFAQPTNSQL